MWDLLCSLQLCSSWHLRQSKALPLLLSHDYSWWKAQVPLKIISFNFNANYLLELFPKLRFTRNTCLSFGFLFWLSCLWEYVLISSLGLSYRKDQIRLCISEFPLNCACMQCALGGGGDCSIVIRCEILCGMCYLFLYFVHWLCKYTHTKIRAHMEWFFLGDCPSFLF